GFGAGLARARVEMHAKVYRWTASGVEIAYDGGDDFFDEPGCCEPDGLCEGDGLDAGVGEQVAGGDDLIDAPGIAIGVAEGHGDVGDDVEAGFIGERSDGFEGVDGFFRRLVLVAFEEAGRDGVGEAEGVDATAV